MLKLAIVGHDVAAHENSLARVTTECCAKHFDIVSITEAEILWCCWDTPIGPGDVPDVDRVMANIRAAGSFVQPGALILISSQLPVGTTARLEAEFPEKNFAYSPENIRVAHGVADFTDQARVVVGRRNDWHDEKLAALFEPFAKRLIFTDTETAECVKHFLNAWLAANICFANEMARFCGKVGADANTVSHALLTERRVSSCAPLKPGAPFGGGHLARDIHIVTELAKWHNLDLPIISNIKRSNGS